MNKNFSYLKICIYNFPLRLPPLGSEPVARWLGLLPMGKDMGARISERSRPYVLGAMARCISSFIRYNGASHLCLGIAGEAVGILNVLSNIIA